MALDKLSGTAGLTVAQVKSQASPSQAERGVNSGEQDLPVQQNQDVQQVHKVDQELRAEREPKADDLSVLVEEMNSRLQQTRRSLHFSVHEDTGKVVIQVLDSETDELIRQIPPEEVVNMAARMRDLNSEALKGVVLKDQA